MERLPFATLERILKDAGAKRVSKSAVMEFNDVIMDFANNIARAAIKFAEHAGRRTVTAKDVKLARKY
ncbi:MAG TPA: histone family protein [Candidatus Aenigmarchaeota archaeon]|nr:MAG: histone [Candidatus Aenigmarchaeota archaeon]HDD46433.1 histone family protein [Candidatus Aenigmarchaeota archaeon]